jgi:predicted hotdog family 3-hydroxylacyl-ACP dehydratase
MTDLCLPCPASALVPHGPPMRLVETLLAVRDGGDAPGGEAAARVLPAWPFVDAAGALDPSALVELAAQAYAALAGWRRRRDGLPAGEGFLVGLKGVRFGRPVRAGEELTVRLTELGGFAGFQLVEAAVLCGPDTVCRGQLKLFAPPAGAGG